MLAGFSRPQFSAIDQEVFDKLILPDHYVRKLLAAVDFSRLREIVAPFYSPDQGRPAEEPLIMLKLEFLSYHHRLSDRQVIEQAKTDVAFRYFLGLDLNGELPDPSTLCYFRGRLGEKGFWGVFNQLVAQAREQGIVKDRLRLKDATHVISAVSIPTVSSLVAQVRDKLLRAAEPFDAVRVAGERIRIELLRQSDDSDDDHRLAARITHLQEILLWAEDLTPPPDAEQNQAWQQLFSACKLACKILADRDPRAGNRTRSVVDPDVRRGKHGDYYDGYLLDVALDADSELITSINVLAGNGDEAVDAIVLIQQEETAHGNDIEQLSMDRVGFNGPVLRELEDPAGRAVHTVVPPKAVPESALFGPDKFVKGRERGVVTCPAGQTSSHGSRDSSNHATRYRFAREVCAACPLRPQCMANPPRAQGRYVQKNDYQAEYDRVFERASTPEYADVRRTHPKIERKLAELIRRHGARHARYRGLSKVLCQQLLTAIVVNLKRLVRLLPAPMAAPSLG